MENDRKMMKVGEKVFFCITNPQQQYKVIGTLGRALTRSKESPTPLFLQFPQIPDFYTPVAPDGRLSQRICDLKVGMFGTRWRMNSGPMKLISRGFVLHARGTKPPEMGSIGPLFTLHRGPNMPIFGSQVLGSLWVHFCADLRHCAPPPQNTIV